MSRLFLIGCVLSLSSASAEDLKLSPRVVSVTGTAVVRAQPDIVVWQVTIRRYDKELARAQSDCNETVKKILALRTEFKVKAEDVQTGLLSIHKIYDRDQAGNQTSFRHFQVERQVTLRQRDTAHFDDVLSRLVNTEDVEVSHHLESSEYHALRAKTRLEAVKAARVKAAAMTELLGAKLGRVLRIAEPLETWGSSYGSASYSFQNVAYAEPRQAAPDEAAGTFAPGSIEIKVSIDVTFEIE